MQNITQVQPHRHFLADLFSSETTAKVSNLSERPTLSTNIAQNVEMRKMSVSEVLNKRLPFLALAFIVGVILVHSSFAFNLEGFILQILGSTFGAYALLKLRHKKADLIFAFIIFTAVGIYLALDRHTAFYTFQLFAGAGAIMAFTMACRFVFSQEWNNTYHLPSLNYIVVLQKINPSVAYFSAVAIYIAIAFLKHL